MQLEKISGIETINPADFDKFYMKPGVPVIIKDFIAGSPALSKWNYEYFRAEAGDMEVSVHGSENAHYDKARSLPVSKMHFSKYLDQIESIPTEQRLFLFNLLRVKPELKQDVCFNMEIKGLLHSYPFMFFGGEGSGVRNHYDIDMSHVFLTQFKGVKKVHLFSNDQSDLLYRLPFNFHSMADTFHPDYHRYPALRYVRGWEAVLHPGDTLFIPAGYWHHVRYMTEGYAVAYRALSSSVVTKLMGVRNIFFTRYFDNAMRGLLNEKWFDYKIKVASKRAAVAIKKLHSGQERNDLENYTDLSRAERIFDV